MKNAFIFFMLIQGSLVSQSNKIKVYFNNTVSNSASPITDAININDFKDTIIAYINRAQTTLDVCNYNTNEIDIVNAVNAAQQRGVTVRYVGSYNNGTNNGEIGNLTVPLIQRPDNEAMHNKFIVFDVNNSNKATILTGSANHTAGSLADDYNNIVIIQDQALAQAYTTEFEEMWGSSTATPNPTNAKFGPNKTDNTPHNFVVDGIPIELYFSPSDNTNAKIVNAINTANTDLSFAMLTFTNNDLGDAVIARQQAGVTVRGVIHNSSYFGSEYNALVNAGADVTSTQTNLSQIMHHKYCVIDATNTNSDPLVVTGSHNWSNSANEDFDENTLIIHDPYIAGQYYEEFMARRPVSINEQLKSKFSIYPTLVKENELAIQGDVSEITQLTIYDINGKKVDSKILVNQVIQLNHLSKGQYFIELTTNLGNVSYPFIKQ